MKPGENYTLISKEEFARKVANKDFIEHTTISGYEYGTCRHELERIRKAGRIPIIEVDVKGAIEINKSGLDGNFMFLYPPSFE